MSKEDIVSESTTKHGLNINLRASPSVIVTIVLSVLGLAVTVIQSMDAKPSRDEVEKIVERKIEALKQGQDFIIESMKEIKADMRYLKGE